MVVRATMQGAHQSPASRGSLAATARRLLVAGLTVTVIATSRPPATPVDGQSLVAARLNAAPLARGGAGQAHSRGGAAPSLQDSGGTVATGASGGQPDVAASTGSAQATDASGKAARPEDVQQQGSVVAVFADPVDPLIVIAVDHGYLTVRLRCGDRCPTVHRGDYVVAEGLGRSEAVFDADDVWVVSP